MTKRIIALFCAAAMLALCGCSAGNKPMLPAGNLRCAVDTSDAEMTSLAEYIASEIGAECVLISSDGEAALSLLENNQADIAVFPYPESYGLDSRFISSFPFGERLVYCVHRSDISMTAVSDCAGLPTGASAALYDETVRTISASAAENRIYCDNAEKAAEMLTDGTLDVYYCFADEAETLLKNDSNLRCTQPADIPAENLSTTVLRSNEKLYSAVNSAIESYLNEPGRLATGGEPNGIL